MDPGRRRAAGASGSLDQHLEAIRAGHAIRIVAARAVSY
jgi:hypothetical protein